MHIEELRSEVMKQSIKFVMENPALPRVHCGYTAPAGLINDAVLLCGRTTVCVHSSFARPGKILAK